MNSKSYVFPKPWFVRNHLLRRWREIASILTRHGLGWILAEVGSESLIPFERGWLGHPRRETPYGRAEHWRMAFGELGPTFIKLGQMLSMRSDLLPPDYIAELSKLQDAAPQVHFERICQIICDELGQPPEKIFSEFSPQPLAAASIGQVHTGMLKDGRAIVVKVQRPGVREQVEQDLEILFGLAEWSKTHTALGRTYDLSALVDEFAFTLRNELDYRREGQNADRFRRNFTDYPGIHVPQVYWEYTTDRVLTMERVGGINIADVAELDQAGISRRMVAENAVNLMLKEVFEFGFFHADPHPGNFFVQPDASIALIDFGMVGYVNQELQDVLLSVGLAVTRQDAERLSDAFFALGVAQGNVNRVTLLRDLDDFLSQYAGRSIQELAATQVTSEVLNIAFRHRLQLPGTLVMLLRLMAMSEALGARLAPDFRLFEFAEPYLRQVWFQNRSPETIGRRLVRSIIDATEFSIELPRRSMRLLNQLEQGELAFNVHHESLDEVVQQFQRMTNRLALAILLAATIVALGLVMVIYHPLGWEQYGGWVFGIGFLLSLAFGGRLMWNMWWSGRK
ncbi:MAG: AarF/ABC1/UbiB kinase family protein [Chloroflexi bacterium]|nr:AarF/ABC1/UbiB kinase family protein [Chloroflexota bacterium]